ncbi:MAG: hypothetical protein ABR604_05910 [Jatrophihabitantaceae bacterium]
MSACSSGTSGNASTSAPAPSAPLPASTTISSGTPGPGSTTPGGPQDRAQRALLTASDLAGGFTAGNYTRRDRPPPCAAAGSPSFRKQTSPQADVGTTLQHAKPRAALGEQIFVYADASTAKHALSTGKAGLSCSTGTVYYSDGSKASIHITPAVDVSSDLAVDSAFAWQLKNADIQGAQVAFALGSLVVVLSFQTVTGTDTSKLPDILSVARFAIAKIKSS